MRFKLYLLLILIPFLSCTNIVTHHLNVSLDELENSREIDKKFLEGYIVKKIRFFKIDENNYKIVLLLNEDISEELLKRYNLGMHIKVEGEYKKYLPKGKNYISWNAPVRIENYQGSKYIIRDVKTPIKKIRSLRFFLYNLGKYENTFGEQIVV